MMDLRIYIKKQIDDYQRENKNNCIRINHIAIRKK